MYSDTVYHNNHYPISAVVHRIPSVNPVKMQTVHLYKYTYHTWVHAYAQMHTCTHMYVHDT